MYYLTKSNGIINDKQIKESKNVFKCGSSICYYVNIDDDEFETLDHIIKQSDNVLDLIEVGDLIGLNKSIGEVLSIQISSGDKFIGVSNEKSSLFNIKYLNNKINAIYKPNANGDYIKVWEKDSE